MKNFVDDCTIDSEEQDLSTQFLQLQRNPKTDLQEHFDRYCIVLPEFGFNSAKYDMNLIKSYVLADLVNERDLEPMVTKKANQLVSFKFGKIQLIQIMNCRGGATSLDFFLKAYKTNETNVFLPYDLFDCKEKLDKEFPPFDSFLSNLRHSNPFEKDYIVFENVLKSGLFKEQAVA